MKYSEMKKSCEIFEKYSDDWFEADHDVIFGPGLDTSFTEKEVETLKELGWSKSSEYDCWSCNC